MVSSQGKISKARVRRLLTDVYRPEGVALWMEREHAEWRMTVDEMFAAGRGSEVVAKAASLAGQVAT